MLKELFSFSFLQQAVSLPCTLRKKNSDSSCHGSNNCYVWAALEIQQIAKRNEESSTASAIVNKCLSTSSKHDADDIESLLLNEHTSASDEMSEHPDETTTINTSSVHDKLYDSQHDEYNN